MDAAEARKAKVASDEAVLMPMPPFLTIIIFIIIIIIIIIIYSIKYNEYRENRTEWKSNANGKRKTQWWPLSLQSHKNTVSSSGVYANVSANVIALYRCSVMKIRWNKNEV